MSDSAAQPSRRALLVFFDNENKVIRFTDANATKAIELMEENFTVEIPLADYLSVPPSEAEEKLGASVFHFLEVAAGRQLGIRNYRQQTEAELADHYRELEALAQSGDPAANYHMYVHSHANALRTRSEDELLRADHFLRRAVDLGHRKAIDALDDWSLVQREARDMIARKKDA